MIIHPSLRTAAVLAACGCLTACGGAEDAVVSGPIPAAANVSPMAYPDPNAIQFDDAARTNAEVADGDLADLTFRNTKGETVNLKDFLGQTNIVLVVTRGNASTGICLYCSTQTSRLISNYDKFAERDAEVLLVFPIEHADDERVLGRFFKSVNQTLGAPDAEVPFPVLLDVALKAVDRLGIRQDLSKPATYILDKQGQVRFAHVGATIADRPSVKAILDQLDALGEAKGRRPQEETPPQEETSTPSEPRTK